MVRDLVAVCYEVAHLIQVFHDVANGNAWIRKQVCKLSRWVDGDVLPEEPFNSFLCHAAALVLVSVGREDSFYSGSP
jgi:hypothetical protein